MNFWLPYTAGNSGSDVSIRFLADALQATGHVAVAEEFDHNYQYFPWLLSHKAPPKDTNVIIGNSWNAFAFKRPDCALIAVERLFILDEALKPYKTFAQSIFHNTLLRSYLWRSYRVADAIVALSESSARSIERVFPGVNARTILNAVDLDYFRPNRRKQPLRDRPVRLLFVGNLIRRKGADLLLPILENLGDGYSLDYTSGPRTSNPLPSHPRASCLGALPLDRVREAYRRADVLLLPTRLEGLPRAAMEALACGTPVVASAVSSLPEIVKDGVNGYTCRVDDVTDFCAAIRTITADQDTLDRLSDNARAFAEEHLDLRKMAERYVRLSQDMISGRGYAACADQTVA